MTELEVWKASGNTPRMENGGKRKRVGFLSLKSFKKPALNYVKKQPVRKYFAKVPTSEGKSNSRLDNTDLTSQEQIETPISENRMKLLNLMPRFPKWESMDLFPLNPLMRSLTESKSEVNDKTTEIHNDSNGSTTKEVKNKNYTDLPKSGIRYISHKIKTQLITGYDESNMKTDELTPAESEMKLTKLVEHETHEFGHGPDDLKYNRVHNNRVLKQVVSTFDLNRVQDDEKIQEYKSSLQELGNVSTDKGLARRSQDKSSAVKTDDIQDNSEVGFDDFEVNGPNLSNQTNIATGTKDNELGEGIGARMSVNVKGSYENNGLLNVKSAKVKDERSGWSNQTMKSNSQFKNEGKERVKHTKSISADRKPSTHFESSAYEESQVMVPSTPPRKEKQTVKGRSMGYNDLQASKSTRSFVNVGQGISKVNSLNRTSYTETQTVKGRSMGCNDLQASKSTRSFVSVGQDISKVNSLNKTSYTKTQTSNSHSKPPRGNGGISKFDSLCKTKSSNEHKDTRKSLGETVYKSNNSKKVNSFCGNNDREAHVEANTSIRRPAFFASGDISKFDWLANTARKDQQLHGKNTIRNSVPASKRNPVYNSSYITNDKHAQVETSQLKETPCFENKDISKIDMDKSTRRGLYGQGMERSCQASKGNPYRSNFYTTFDKQTHLQSCKETSDISAQTSKGQFGRALKDMDGGLESDEDLFGSDDDLDELLVNSSTYDFDQMNCHLGTEGDRNDLKWIENDVINDDGCMKDLLGNLDNDMDDDTLVACCDDAMSPTIQVRENGPNSRLSGSLRNEMTSKGVKRKLNISDAQTAAQSKVRRSGSSYIPADNVGISRALDKFCESDDDERINECPFCAKSFHSRFSKGDINQHIAMCCCSSDDIGIDDAFW